MATIVFGKVRAARDILDVMVCEELMFEMDILQDHEGD